MSTAFHKNPVFSTLILALILLAGLSSCAGTPDAKSTVMEENRGRSYDRFKADHDVIDDSDLNKAGIYVYGRSIVVVISLTDAGADRYPEWAAEKLLTVLYGYRAVDQTKVSDDEFYELVTRFALEGIVEGKYENLARIKIDERDVNSFVEHYEEDL